MTLASDSSSSVASSELDLVELGLLPPLPRAFLAGSDRDLLAPLEFLAPGTLPAVRPAATDRSALAAGLAAANAAYGHAHARKLATKLADAATAVVVTGQQPGLFGGPLYALSKAVAAARWAAELEASGQPAVAVYWMATEDHDFRECSWAAFAAPGGRQRVDLGADEQPLMPVGMRSFGPRIETVLAELRAANASERFGDWCDTLAEWYTPTARFGEAFARLLVHLLGERCPLLLDAMLPAVKHAQQPWLRALVERRQAVEEALVQASARVADRGYPLQVTPQPGTSPLFFLSSGERRRIVWGADETWSLRGEESRSRPLSELQEAITDNPAVVMPGVLCRPLVQDAILGATLQVMGPGEMSYLPQLASLYDLLEVPAPATALRPQALLLGGNHLKKLAAAGLTLSDLIAPDFDLDRLLAGAGAAERLRPVEQQLAALEAALETAAEPVSAELGSALDKTGAQLHRGVDQFGQRLTAALGRADAVQRGRVEGLYRWLRPGGKLQERVLSSADPFGRYGPAVVDALFDQLTLDGGRQQVITP